MNSECDDLMRLKNGGTLPNSNSTTISSLIARGAQPAKSAIAIGKVSASGIEVTQCIQDVNNSVTLIANKITVVRVYLDHSSFSRKARITGEIAWSRGGSETYLPALNAIQVDPAAPLSLEDQRPEVSAGLNFQLPISALGAGTLKLRVSRLREFGGDDLPMGGVLDAFVDLVEAPPLRIRVIGLRYNNGARDVAPAAVHFSHLKSFLLRAYPIAAMQWSQIVVDADFGPPFGEDAADLANAQIAAIRNVEIGSGVDHRTHYYGLVDDDNSMNFMRGKAHGIPGTPQPDVVASGPAGVPNGFGGDFDLTYADWYGAHELGHTFGRYHPGFPAGAQDASDAQFPYANGCISTPDKRFVGMDVGDAVLGLNFIALDGIQHHDVMTYGDRQWISPYTYQAILARLIQEDAL